MKRFTPDQRAELIDRARKAVGKIRGYGFTAKKLYFYENPKARRSLVANVINGRIAHETITANLEKIVEQLETKFK